MQRIGLTLAVLSCAAVARTATHEVASIAELQARLAQAKAGDVIVVRDGAYTTSAPIKTRRPWAT